MFKVTMLYGHPDDARAFEEYYTETHLPLAAMMEGIAKLELTQFRTGLYARRLESEGRQGVSVHCRLEGGR